MQNYDKVVGEGNQDPVYRVVLITLVCCSVPLQCSATGPPSLETSPDPQIQHDQPRPTNFLLPSICILPLMLCPFHSASNRPITRQHADSAAST